jgi:hypothetical protein
MLLTRQSFSKIHDSSPAFFNPPDTSQRAALIANDFLSHPTVQPPLPKTAHAKARRIISISALILGALA